jgi:hypothetical protein
MVDASQAFIINTPAGNGVKHVGAFAINLGPSIVRRILITWPAGCGGLLFIQIQAGNGYAFPNQQGQFLAFDDYTYAFDVSNQIDSGQWSVVSYNMDYIGHDPIVTFEFDYLRGTVTSSAVTPIAL